MHTPTRARIATIAGVVLAVAASLPASAGVIMRATPAHAQPAFMTNPAGRLKRLLAPPPRLHMPLGGRHHMGPLATSYTIDDVGAPAQQSIELEAPAMFNNDGQMVGYEYNTATNTNNCIAYTGRRWVRINPATFTDCSPMSMSNPNPNTGAFAVVGWGETPNIDGQVGFSATVSRAARFRATTSHDPSEVDAVNSAGTAVGYAFYRPQSGFFETYPPFVLTGSRFRPLQPQCTTQQPLCMADIMTDELTDGCPFGGCAVNDLNVVFGDDYDSDWFYEVMTVGQSGSGQNLPIPWGTLYPVGINDAYQITYALNASGTYQAWQYTVGASQPVALGGIPGSTCTSYYPFAQNNAGVVLGYAFDCVSGTPTYWIWDSVNGMQDLDAEIPPNSYSSITPYGVNDAGQILVDLYDSGATHWGTLVPSPSAKRNKR